MKEPSVYIIILNYNHFEDLKETISSFLNQDYKNMHLVVSDNGSSDSSVSWLKNNHPEITLIENNKNLGYAEGNNIGIKYSVENGADYILLANNDLSFSNPEIIRVLIDQMQNNGRWIMGPVQNYYFEPEKEFSCGHLFMNVERFSFNRLRLKYLENNTFPGNLKVVDYVAGSFVLFPSGLINDIGYIDPDFYLYGEDADFFLRAWKAGYVSLVDKNLTILHKVSATSGPGSPKKKYYQSRNIWINFRKHKDLSKNILVFKLLAIKGSLKNIFLDFINFRFKHAQANIKGLWHGIILHKTGEGDSF